MSTVPRNAPCPCGSGRKHKLCCGTTQSQERAQREAFQNLLSLADAFPLLRPESDDFERWLDAHVGEMPTRDLVERGVNLLSVRERERISRSFARWFPPAWAHLVAGVEDADAAEKMVLVGSVTAALAEERLPGAFVLDLLEDDRDLADPAEALALCIAPGDLWSIREALAADHAVAVIPDELDDDEYARVWEIVLGRESRDFRTKRHERRLLLLVRRLQRELPISGSPRASEVLARACARFERDRRIRAQVAALLLADKAGYLATEQFRRAA